MTEIAVAKADEGQRVLRNAVSIGSFLMAPLTLMLMVRALGDTGYGEWWRTFVLLEASGIVGMLAVDLYVRREVAAADDERELVQVIGSGLAITVTTGLVFAIAMFAFAAPLARAQHDDGLAPFFAILAAQPLMWNATGVLGAALQARNRLGLLAVLRGLVFPLLQAALYFLAWRGGWAIRTTLWSMLATTVLAVIATCALYARYFSLAATVRAMFAPTHARAALRYGSRMFAPLVLFTLGGKLDLYVLGAYTPAAVTMYAACLQMASGVPNVRGLFDPIIQTQIGALHARNDAALAESLRKLARLCAFALAPAYVVTVAVGEPVLGALIGHRDPGAEWPLAVLATGNLLGCLAVGSWLTSMLYAGRVLAVIAAGAGLAKLALLLVLVPSYGPVGAAIATAIGAILAMQAQALVGSRRRGFQPYPGSLAAICALTLVMAAAGHALFAALDARMSELVAVAIAGAASVGALAIGLWLLSTADDRAALRGLLGLAPRSSRREAPP